MFKIRAASGTWDPRYDAEVLQKSMKGVGVYDKVLIEIFSSRSRKDLQEIKRSFQELYGKSIESWIKTNCSGNFGKILLDLCEERHQLKCQYLRKSVINKDSDTMIEILCCSSNEELKKLNECYRRLFGNELNSVIDVSLSRDFRELMREVLKCSRSSDEFVAERRVREDAEILWSEKGDPRASDRMFCEILTHRSRAHLQRLFAYYEQTTWYSYQRALPVNGSPDFQRAALAIIMPQHEFHAQLFSDAMKGGVLNHNQLVKLVSTLTKAELEQANRFFTKIHNRSLQEAIKDGTSGSYQRLLCAMVPQAE